MNAESRNARVTAVIKRSLYLHGKKTSVSLEDEFWQALQEAAAVGQTSVRALVERIDREKTTCNLSSAIRLFVFRWERQKNGSALDSRQLRDQLEGHHKDQDVELSRTDVNSP